MFNREFWDRELPDGADLWAAVDRIMRRRVTESVILPAGLAWLAEVHESDHFPRPAWRSEIPIVHESAWSIRPHGLNYKGSDSYMTAEGWCLGSTCWYVTVECGFRDHVIAETPELCMRRAIVFVAATRKWRDTHPKRRSSLHEFVIREMHPERAPADQV